VQVGRQLPGPARSAAAGPAPPPEACTAGNIANCCCSTRRLEDGQRGRFLIDLAPRLAPNAARSLVGEEKIG